MCEFGENEIYDTVEAPQPVRIRRTELRPTQPEEAVAVAPASIATERPAPAVAAAET